jgi:hypothetical protein
MICHHLSISVGAGGPALAPTFPWSRENAMTYLSRRAVISGAAALPVLAMTVGPISDPVIAAIAAHRAATGEYLAACESYQATVDMIVTEHATEETRHGWTAAELRIQTAHETMIAAEGTLARTAPTTAAGIAALMLYATANGEPVVPSAADWRTRGIN